MGWNNAFVVEDFVFCMDGIFIMFETLRCMIFQYLFKTMMVAFKCGTWVYVNYDKIEFISITIDNITQKANIGL